MVACCGWCVGFHLLVFVHSRFHYGVVVCIYDVGHFLPSWCCQVLCFLLLLVLTAVLACGVWSGREGAVGMGYIVDMPVPYIFVKWDMDPVAQFSVGVLSLVSGGLSCCFVYLRDGFKHFFW